jgi:two-component system response regulator PilR (NtrC family)
MPAVLLVDDEPDIIEILEMVLREEDMDVYTSRSAREALDVLRDRTVDVVVSDIRMPDLTGVELLRQAKQLSPETVFVMMTAFASTETAIEALQHGAFDYLTKPFRMEELKKIVAQALRRRNLKPVPPASHAELEARQSKRLFQALARTQIIGKSERMLEVYRTIGTVAAGESTVLITGESGTGKELAARAIHEASLRKDGAFLSINCSAFPETLLESELFGYMKGAFTGAGTNRKGLFEVACGGSIFLDEIGEMTPAMQVKLLRVLQERKLRPLGGNSEVSIDVRVIAATNKDLQSEISRGQFREDLFYRIAVITIDLPPLRERAEDIDLLAYHFLRQYAEKTGRRVFGIAREALRCLESYRWPGNVRELENTIERAVALETTDQIQLDRLPEAVVLNQAPPPVGELFELPRGIFDLQGFMADLERSLICQALQRCDGNQTLAAQQLGLTKPSLRHRIQALSIDASSFRRKLTAESS